MTDILEASQAIAQFISDMDQSVFMQDELHQSAVLHKLLVIGEATARLPKEFRAKYPDVAWSDIIGFRNIIAHAYFVIDWSIVWTTAVHDVPLLQQQMAYILREEFPKD